MGAETKTGAETKKEDEEDDSEEEGLDDEEPGDGDEEHEKRKGEKALQWCEASARRWCCGPKKPEYGMAGAKPMCHLRKGAKGDFPAVPKAVVPRAAMLQAGKGGIGI